METLTLKADLVNAILQYLGTKPYVESAPLIAGIQEAAKAQAAPVEEVK